MTRAVTMGYEIGVPQGNHYFTPEWCCVVTIEVSRVMSVPHEKVWAALADLGSHTDWMRDARSITFTSEQTRGVGTTMEVETRVGPLRSVDLLEVTGWEEGRRIETAHHGMVKGTGILSARPEGRNRTVVSWQESLRFPWWLGGRLGELVAAPVLKKVFAANLERLERMLSSPGNGPLVSR